MPFFLLCCYSLLCTSTDMKFLPQSINRPLTSSGKAQTTFHPTGTSQLHSNIQTPADLVSCTPNSWKGKLNAGLVSPFIFLSVLTEKSKPLFTKNHVPFGCVRSLVFHFFVAVNLPATGNDGDFNFPMCTLAWNTESNHIEVSIVLYK